MIRAALTVLLVAMAFATACSDGGGSGPGGGSAGQAPGTGGGAASGTGGSDASGGTGGVDCNCLRGAYFPVCGVDGQTHDATCGRECVPVAIACDGECPCPAGVGGTGSAGCSTDCTTQGLTCCDGRCVNTGNDPDNCGACGTVCSGAASFCNGTCTAPTCDAATSCAAGETCCGSSCCSGEQMCCLIMQGPWSTQCTDPVDGTCPVGCPLCDCADPDTPVATPTGERRIADLRVGDLVYSVDQKGVTVAPIVETRRTPVRHHHVVRVELSSGRVLELSGPHPTVDGRRFSDLAAGQTLDGTRIVSVELIDYRHAFTYDILPATDTGAYFAGGVAIGSTLMQAP